MVSRSELESHLAAMRMVERFRDYGANGLQVEGRAEIRVLASGVVLIDGEKSGPTHRPIEIGNSA